MKIIRIPRLAYLGVVVLLFCVFFFFVGSPTFLWWLLLLPVAVAVWVTRTQTTVSEKGLDLRTVFGSRHLDWAQVKGVRIPKRGFVRAHLADDSEVKLPAVSYDRLRDLIAASKGRIPDLFAAAAEAEDRAYAERVASEESADNRDDATPGDATSSDDTSGDEQRPTKDA
ncbi:PH domain-containing protein [Nocardia sp. NPDC050710]|uniref:PH domain-containing protein n=1 Tax=Nocardia sp. NPDC050710 TaxID=3157220 RepID=UPI0034028E48